MDKAFSRTLSILIPCPSSLILMTISEPSRVITNDSKPLAALPWLSRSSLSSIPCAIALRRICSNGATRRSRIVLSISSSEPRIFNSTFLPSSDAVCLTMRSSRPTIPLKGSKRVVIRPCCKSVLSRDCCNRIASVSLTKVSIE